jgi:hypothetical protein
MPLLCLCGGITCKVGEQQARIMAIFSTSNCISKLTTLPSHIVFYTEDKCISGG